MRKLKGILLGWIYKVASMLPTPLAVLIVNRTWPWGRPVLDYVEFHLADHCNLNCAGCMHFAPYADKRFANIEIVRRDLSRLKELFSNVRHIRIMGGEPLLHSDAAAFVRLTREIFSRSKIRLVTNGLKLLGGVDGSVSDTLKAMRETNVGMDWTCYPPIEKRRSEIVKICKEAGVQLRISDNDAFMVRMRPKGDGNPASAFRWCRRCLYCPLLDDGRLYLCAQAHYVDYYNRAAGTNLPKDDGIDIHSASAREILLYLMRPSHACAYCDAGSRHFAWKNDFKPEDWWR